MNRGILTAAGILIASHALVSLISYHGGEPVIPSFYPAPFDTMLTIRTEPAVDDTATVESSAVPVTSAPALVEPIAQQGTETPVADESQDMTEGAGQEFSVDMTADEADSAPLSPLSPAVETTPLETPAAPPLVLLDEIPTEMEKEPELSREDSLLILIPERAWSDSHRVRGDLTPEIAQEYPVGQYVPRTVENTVWGVGEQLVFSIDYGFLNAGTATMSVLGTETVNGAECYHIQTTARSNDFISTFYEVRDQVNSYIDTNGIFSRRIEKLLREGSYKSDRYVDFYPDRTIAISNEKKKQVTEIPLYVQDVLSSLYLIRTYDLEVGTDVYIDTYADGKVYPLRIKVHKTEKIKVPAGTFTCWVVEPLLQSDGIFRQKGQLKVWLTKDEHKMPVKMTSKIVIGSIGTNLESYTLGTP